MPGPKRPAPGKSPNEAFSGASAPDSDIPVKNRSGFPGGPQFDAGAEASHGCFLRRSIQISLILLAVFFVSIAAGTGFAEDCINGRHLFDIETGADQPSDLALAPNGDVYLVDGVNHRVVVFDSRGRRKFEFGREGDGPGQFRRPLGIDISDQGRVFVADSGNRRIQVLDLGGRFEHMFAVGAGPRGKPSDPVDVLVSRLKDYVYVADNDNHRILMYRQNGRFELEWGKFGEGPGEFRYPAMMALNEYNQVFVVDVLNTRVQKFDPFGNFIAEIGSWGVLPGKLFRPKGVAVDKKNRVYVGDSYMGFVQVFSDLGRFLGVVCESGIHRRFTTPVGMVVDDKNKTLQVVEMRPARVVALQFFD